MLLIDLIKIITKLDLRLLTFDNFILPMLYDCKVGDNIFKILEVVKSVPDF
jgi:hypothetical protein